MRLRGTTTSPVRRQNGSHGAALRAEVRSQYRSLKKLFSIRKAYNKAYTTDHGGMIKYDKPQCTNARTKPAAGRSRRPRPRPTHDATRTGQRPLRRLSYAVEYRQAD